MLGPETVGVSRRQIVAVARGWLGTPYHHQASVRGVGADCLGLLRGVWREVYGSEAELPPAYSRDWAEASRRETLIEAAERHLVRIDPEAASAGDVLVFRLRDGVPAKHVGLLATPATMIHAIENAPVTEVAFQAWWQRRVADVFAFPGVHD